MEDEKELSLDITHERMKYIMCKLLQDKPKSESILKRLRSQTSREKLEKDL
jgi:hypothetical protein